MALLPAAACCLLLCCLLLQDEEERVVPRVPFAACLHAFAGDATVEDYQSAAAGKKVQVSVSVGVGAHQHGGAGAPWGRRVSHTPSRLPLALT